MCRQIWWVQRIRTAAFVLNKKKFRITWPECDWDTEVQEWLEYATISRHEAARKCVIMLPWSLSPLYLDSPPARFSSLFMPRQGKPERLVMHDILPLATQKRSHSLCVHVISFWCRSICVYEISIYDRQPPLGETGPIV